jgi:hypothetical protein
MSVKPVRALTPLLKREFSAPLLLLSTQTLGCLAEVLRAFAKPASRQMWDF